MLTSFGKTLRKLRIDNEELLKDMALKLGVTLAYLSAVEKFDVENLDDEAKRMVVLFAKRFKDLSQGQIFQINKILEDKGNDD